MAILVGNELLHPAVSECFIQLLVEVGDIGRSFLVALKKGSFAGEKKVGVDGEMGC